MYRIFIPRLINSQQAEGVCRLEKSVDESCGLTLQRRMLIRMDFDLAQSVALVRRMPWTPTSLDSKRRCAPSNKASGSSRWTTCSCARCSATNESNELLSSRQLLKASDKNFTTRSQLSMGPRSAAHFSICPGRRSTTEPARRSRFKLLRRLSLSDRQSCLHLLCSNVTRMQIASKLK